MVTNYHIFAGCDKIEIKRRDTIIAHGGIIGISIEKDILIIKLDNPDFPNITIADEGSLKVGQKVYAIGSPLGLENTMSEGIISGFRKIGLAENDYIQISASLSHGSSGGAVLNSRGELIGMSSMGMEEGQNINFAIPVSDIIEVNKGSITDKKTLEALTYFFKGYNECESGNYEEAVKEYTRYIEISPLEAKAFNYRGIAYMKLAKYEKAISDFTKAIKIDPNFVPPYLNRAEVYIKTEEFEKAAKDISTLIRLEPDNTDAYYARGLAYSKDSEYRKAIKDFTKVIELEPTYVSAYINRGFAFYSIEEYARAIEDWNFSIKLEPSLERDLRPFINRADLMDRLR
jgi:Flp pilus assembly protein TadD